MIKFTSFSLKISPITGYYLQFLTQSGKFSLFFLSPYSYAKVSRNIFPNYPPDYFLSSSPVLTFTEYAWALNFKNGSEYLSYRNNNFYVRLVRGRQ